MATTIRLGKIKKVRVGFGGYQEAQFGVSFDLGGDGWGVGAFWGFWAMKPSEHAAWNEAAQLAAYGNTMARLRDLMGEAKAQEAHQLVGKPLSVTFENGRMKEWRILTEVL